MTPADNALREGVDDVTVEMLAAAWEVVRDRYPNSRVLGPGPGFREAIAAALALRPLCDLEVRVVEAETKAEVDREFAETSRRQADAVRADADGLREQLADAVVEVERLRAALEPFAEYARLSEEAGLDIGDGEIGEFIHRGLRRSISTRALREARTALARAGRADKPEGVEHG